MLAWSMLSFWKTAPDTQASRGSSWFSIGSAPKIDISVTSLPKDVLNDMTNKESLPVIWRQWTHRANIKNALEMDGLNTCNVDVNGLCPRQSSFTHWLCLCSEMHIYSCVLKVWPALVRWWVKMCSLCMNKQMWKKKGKGHCHHRCRRCHHHHSDVSLSHDSSVASSKVIFPESAI
jgi:hypothetical protein